MGLTIRKESYYGEFPVLDDGKMQTLARGGAGGEAQTVEGRDAQPHNRQAAGGPHQN